MVFDVLFQYTILLSRHPNLSLSLSLSDEKIEKKYHQNYDVFQFKKPTFKLV